MRADLTLRSLFPGRAVCLVTVLLASCAARNDAAESITVPTSPPAAEASAPAAPRRAAQETKPGPLSWPLDAACVVTGRDVWLDARMPLRVRPGGAVFANAFSASVAKLAVPPSNDPAPVIAELESGGLVVRGAVDPDAFSVHPARAIALGGFFVPRPGAVMHVVAADQGSVSVRPDLDARIVVSKALVDAVACADLTLGEPTYDVSTALPHAGASKWDQILAGEIDLSVTESGAPTVKLHVEKGHELTGEVIATGGAKDQLAIAMDNDLVFGWIAHGSLRPVAAGSGTGYGYGRGDGVAIRPKHLRRDQCERDLDAQVEIDGSTHFVGTVRAGTVIDVLSEDAGGASIFIESTRIGLADHVRLFVDEHDAACSPVTETSKRR